VQDRHLDAVRAKALDDTRDDTLLERQVIRYIIHVVAGLTRADGHQGAVRAKPQRENAMVSLAALEGMAQGRAEEGRSEGRSEGGPDPLLAVHVRARLAAWSTRGIHARGPAVSTAPSRVQPLFDQTTRNSPPCPA